MIIGNKSKIAFEVKGCESEFSFLKDSFWWLNNDQIGVEGTFFKTYVNEAESFLERLQRQSLKFPELNSLSDEEVLELLENILVEDKSFKSLNSTNVYELLLIASWDFALDDWHFYITEEETVYRFIWRKRETKKVNSIKVEKEEVIKTLQSFIKHSKEKLNEM